MKKLILALVVISLGFAGIMIYNFAHNVTGFRHERALGPRALQIPAIHVDASVMGVGRTSTGPWTRRCRRPTIRLIGAVFSGTTWGPRPDNLETR